jgi:tetratricopeptide (TPR) repeat protein
VTIKPDHKKLVYLVLSIAYKRVDENLNSLEILSKGVKYFPEFSDIYLARAHIYLFLKQYQNALNDFRSFNKYSFKKTAGYLGEGDALKKLGRLSEAIDCYTKIINDPQIYQSSNPLYTTAIERRALTYFINKNYKKARDDFENITNIL